MKMKIWKTKMNQTNIWKIGKMDYTEILFPRKNSNFSSELNNFSHQPTSGDYLE